MAKAPVQYPELKPGALFVRGINHGGINPRTDRAQVLDKVMQGLHITGSNGRGMGMHVRFRDICFTCGGVPAIDLPCKCGKRVLYRVFYDPDTGPGVYSIGSRVTIPIDVPTGDDPKDGWYLFVSSPDVDTIRRLLRSERLRARK